MSYRKTKGMKQLKGKVSKMEKFGEFWTEIWEDNAKTPHRIWMNTVAKKIGQKVTNVQEFKIIEKKLHQTVKKQKNLPVPGIAGVQNFWWKNFRGTLSATLRCFNKWLEQLDEIPDWLTKGRTVLLPKTEDLSNERNYRPITCLNTYYKIYGHD